MLNYSLVERQVRLVLVAINARCAKVSLSVRKKEKIYNLDLNKNTV